MQLNFPLAFAAAGVLVVGLGLGQALTSAAQAQEPVPAPSPAPQPAPGDTALALKVHELEARLGALEAWVEAQKAQAKSTVAALAEAEAAGFTAGINPRSREILLAAWRAEAAKAQESGSSPASRIPDRRETR